VSYPRKKARSRVGQIVARYCVRPVTEYDPDRPQQKAPLAHNIPPGALGAKTMSGRQPASVSCRRLKVERQELATQS